MKIQTQHFNQQSTGNLVSPRWNERGSATVVFMALLAIMMILVTAESRALLHLRREAKFLEQQQIKRLNASQTNNVTATGPHSR